MDVALQRRCCPGPQPWFGHTCKIFQGPCCQVECATNSFAGGSLNTSSKLLKQRPSANPACGCRIKSICLPECHTLAVHKKSSDKGHGLKKHLWARKRLLWLLACAGFLLQPPLLSAIPTKGLMTIPSDPKQKMSSSWHICAASVRLLKSQNEEPAW